MAYIEERLEALEDKNRALGLVVEGLAKSINQLREARKNSSLKCKRIDKEAKLPTRKHPDDAGIDVYSLGHNRIPPHSYKIVKTGVTFDFPKDTVVFAWPKSRNEHLVGAGVIDCGYQGEILIKVFNTSNDTYLIEKHDGIAQLVIVPVLYPPIEEVDEIHEVASERGDTGGIAGNAT